MSDLHSVSAAVDLAGSQSRGEQDQLAELQTEIEHLAHLLPSQAPIQVFVHHNTLHAFEDLPFDQAVAEGARTYSRQPYLPEARYRQELSRGRILARDLADVLIEDLGDAGDELIGFLATRHHLRLSMLQHPLRLGSDVELRWLIAESDALHTFLPEAGIQVTRQIIERTKRWMLRDLRDVSIADERVGPLVEPLLVRYGKAHIENWNDDIWREFTLHLMWQLCHAGVHGAPAFRESPRLPVRHRDWLYRATGEDSDRLVNDLLIRFCGVFLDQGVADWRLPDRQAGFLRAFTSLYSGRRPIEPWLRNLPRELARLTAEGLGPLASIDESLRILGVHPFEREEYLKLTLLALPGWAGMCWQMETNAEWTAQPAPRGTLVEYLAVRLILERLAVTTLADEHFGQTIPLDQLRGKLRKGVSRGERVSVEQRAFLVFQLAQQIGWSPHDLYRLTKPEWFRLVEEIERFSSDERRRVYHLAYERRYRTQMLDAIRAHRPTPAAPGRPRFQIVCCIDEREESFRRHLEEVAPDCETFGTAGFFGVAMYYRGVADAQFVPLCPIVVKPRHFVEEEVAYSFENSHRRRAGARRAIGAASHRMHVGSRSPLAGIFAALLGTLASVPLVARVLFPRATARLRRAFGGIVEPPPMTRLWIERQEPEPGRHNGERGYSINEMVDIAERVLRDLAITQFARLVMIAGHGSSSLNNPHESAYDCGACGGGRGGPNARAFANILSDPRVRERLATRGIHIPRDTVFLGAFHNTCDDSVDFFDLDRLPSSHHAEFERLSRDLHEASCRNAHERCRRFESAELTITPEAALRHVEARGEDLSQVRPEYGHSTNAMCYVGRRAATRGLYFDRRSFLVSYDGKRDTPRHEILERILQAVVPVCGGISLEYYFCSVDPTGYGCGTKLPHNIASMLGVMDGATSDLRSGLNWQMVEIHEPMRLLFVIESSPEVICELMERNPGIERLIRNEWVQVVTFDPDTKATFIWHRGQFEPYNADFVKLPKVRTSVEWYRGLRHHLGPAAIIGLNAAAEPEVEAP